MTNTHSLISVPQRPLVFFLSSPGGDVEEAERLAQTLRKVMAEVHVGEGMICASSCFLLYVNAPIRFGLGTIAVHRPFLSPERVRGMSAEDAARLHSQIYQSVKRWLQERLVPQVIIDKMLSVPSSAAYKLTSQDVEQLGMRSAWYEEWLLARCPDYLNAESAERKTSEQNQAARERYGRAVDCEMEALSPEISNGLGSVIIRKAVENSNKARDARAAPRQ